MSQIQELPTERDFGLEFNYAAWTAGTVVMLCTVPWNADYRDIVRFPDQNAVDEYLNNSMGPKITLTGMTYANPGDPIRIDLPLNAVYKYNYLRVFNPSQPVSGDEPKSFYYFIREPRRLAPNTTQLFIQLDVWQTFGYGIAFGNCYIERGHIGVANQDQFADYGREFLTTPEGIDLGGEYEIVDQFKHQIASATRKPGESQPNFSVMVTSNVSLTDEPGTVEKPNLVSAGGSDFESLPNGSSMYLFDTLQDFKDFMFMFAQKPWITQGIIAITVIPRDDVYGINTNDVVIGDITIKEMRGNIFKNNIVAMKNNWRDAVELPARYAHLHKFKTYPYMVLEMTSYTGTPLMLKPESWSNPHAIVVEIPHFAPPSARIMFVPFRYNAAGAFDPTFPTEFQDGIFNDGGEFLDMATGIFNFPTFSTVNNGYTSFMAANTNSVAFQHTSADWSQQRATAGITNSFDNAKAGVDLSKNVAGQSISANTQQTTLQNETAGWNALKGGANGVIGAHSALGAGMAVANSAADYAIGLNQRNQSMGIANNLAGGVNRAQTENALQMADRNQAYANFAAKGDYQNEIAGINAKVQDARLIQPTTSGQVGGDAFNLSTYKWGYDVKVKMVQAAAMNAIGDMWLRYGYAVNRFGRMPASFMVCEKFTYWKLKESYITSAVCPEQFKQAIRGIFEKGVTVWSNPADIGNIDIADNAPLEGIVL